MGQFGFDPHIGALAVCPFGTPPYGFLECDGSAISRTAYARLFAVIGVKFGNGDGSTTFNLPDLRGYFLRGWDHGAGNDPDAATRTDRGDGTIGDYIGTQQADEIVSHNHDGGVSLDMGTGGTAKNRSSEGGFNSDASGGNESRPTNVNGMICVKYV